MTESNETKRYCGNCGKDITASGVCTVCDELCEHCNEKRIFHVGVAFNVLVCPKTVFSGSGNYDD